jgi:anti-sigma factor RsiW
MKASDNNPNPCDPERLSRYHDDELTFQDREQVEAHLETCPVCRSMLADFNRLSHMTREHADRSLAAFDSEALTQGVLTRMPRSPRAPVNWRSWFKPSRLFLPVAVTVLALAIYIIPRPFRSESTGAPPSAIINSFTGAVTSVMLFETPNTHQTIIWISEDATTNGEDDAV